MGKVVISVFLTVLLSGLPGWSQSDQPQKPQTARFGDASGVARHLQDLFYGVVKRLGKNEMVLEKTKFGIDQPVKLDGKTKYIFDGKRGKFESLKVGEQVWLQVKTDKKTGDMIAQRVYAGVMAPTVEK